MSCRTESTEIGEHTISVTQWPAEKALSMKFKLLKALGPGFAKLGGALKAESSDGDELNAISEGLSLLFEHNTPEDAVALIKECLLGVSIDGKKLTPTGFTEFFSGDDLARIYPILWFILKVNYGNLLQGQSVEGLLAKLK